MVKFPGPSGETIASNAPPPLQGWYDAASSADALSSHCGLKSSSHMVPFSKDCTKESASSHRKAPAITHDSFE